MKHGRLPAPPFLLLGAASLLAGMWAGLLRLPLALAEPHAQFAVFHGPLMAGAFLGTVIAAERAAALGGRMVHWLPAALNGLAGLLFLAGPLLLSPPTVAVAAPTLLILGAAGLVLLFVLILRRQFVFFNQVMTLGALALLVGNILLWTGRPAAHAAPWWAAFLVLTIAGERLELNRLLRPSPWAALAFRGILALQLAGLILSVWSPEAATRLLGAGHLALAGWLAVNDVARRTIKLKGLARHAAVCLLSGYAWLSVAGLLALFGPFQLAGTWHDASLHSLFLGFVFAMIFGHAPIIVPALTGRLVRVGSVTYMPLVLLHVSLITRIAGDLAAMHTLRVWGGVGGVAAILLFLLVTVVSLEKPTMPA